MVKSRSSIKRLSTASQSTAVKGVDVKARRRIEELFELTDEIINAYNEINEKYVQQIYRKYENIKSKYEKLKKEGFQHHCAGCQCDRTSSTDQNGTEIDEPEKLSQTTSSIVTRSKKNNPFIISDVDETQNFDKKMTRQKRSFDDNNDDDDEEEESDRDSKKKEKDDEESPDEAGDEEAEEEEEENDDNSDETNEQAADGNKNGTNENENGIRRLPLAIRTIIQRKIERNRAKSYLREIWRYNDLCQYMRDQSRRSFDLRPSEELVKPFVAKYVHPNRPTDGKFRMRIRDELREIHRSYLRTFMDDPHSARSFGKISKPKLSLKRSP